MCYTKDIKDIPQGILPNIQSSAPPLLPSDLSKVNGVKAMALPSTDANQLLTSASSSAGVLASIPNGMVVINYKLIDCCLSTAL